MKTTENAQRIVTGTHILGELFSEARGVLERKVFVKRAISRLIRGYGLSELGSVQHAFPGGGFTLVICLSESHISVHTWPELGYVTLDVFLCNYSRNNAVICKKIFHDIARIFSPTKKVIHVIAR